MTTFFIRNFGCRATQADADAIRHSLHAQGHAVAESDSSADIVVLNTCTVTAAADAEARESIRRIHRQNPAARIIATGCYAQRAPEELAALPGVSWLVGNSHQHAIASLANEAVAAANFVPLSAVSANAHSSHSQNSGRMQSSLRLLHHSSRPRTQPQPRPRSNPWRNPSPRRNRRAGSRTQRNRPWQLRSRPHAAHFTPRARSQNSR